MSGNGKPSKGLAFQNVEIALNGDRLLALDALISPGEVLTVMGPSGSGKSTLLAFAAGFLDPVFRASGHLLLDGVDITNEPAPMRHMGLLFQDPMLFPHMSVEGNLLFGLAPDIRARADRRDAVGKALCDIGLDGFGPRDPATLSGGQKARVALMRTMLSNPRALLLDEPFSKLDTALKNQIRQLVFAQARAKGLPVLLVTHDPEDAKAAGGECIELEALSLG